MFVHPTLFFADQPGDSGVGVSVDSSSNFLSQKQMSATTLQALKSKASIYARRSFTESFHDFVEYCSILDANERPSAKEFLTSNSFLKLPKKSSGLISIAHWLAAGSPDKGSPKTRSKSATKGDHLAQKMDCLEIEEPLQWEF